MPMLALAITKQSYSIVRLYSRALCGQKVAIQHRSSLLADTSVYSCKPFVLRSAVCMNYFVSGLTVADRCNCPHNRPNVL